MRCEDQHLAAWVLGAMFMCFLREVLRVASTIFILFREYVLRYFVDKKQIIEISEFQPCERAKLLMFEAFFQSPRTSVT